MSDRTGGSGAATNAGIDYQQRVGALLLASALLDLPIHYFFEDAPDAHIREIAFETASQVDDIEVRLDDGSIMFIQAKRALDLSTVEGTDFVKTIAQFVARHVESNRSNEFLVLVTSPDASSKIVRDLRKILLSIRLNDANFTANPLSKSERASLDRFRQVTETLYRAKTGQELTDQAFVLFARSVFVVSLDVQQGGSVEKALVTSLAQQSRVSPHMLWAILIKNALTYATGRLSINREGLESAVGRFMKRSESEDDSKIREEFDVFTWEQLGSVAAGKEVLLVEPPADQPVVNSNSLIVLELYRYEDDCRIRHEFYGHNKCRPIGTDQVWTILCRCSTIVGLVRYLEENVSQIQGKGLTHLSADGIDDAEAANCARAHAELCMKLLRENPRKLNCLHCGKPISENGCPLIEVDDLESPHAVGHVHSECQRPIDRVIGFLGSDFFENHDYLKHFDIENWVRLIRGGQGVFNDIKSIGYGGIIPIAWKPDYAHDQQDSHCIRIDLEDGSLQYVNDRAKVHRLPETKARQVVDQYNHWFRQAREAKDPICYTSKRHAFGAYSQLIARKADDEHCIECRSAEVVRYNVLIGKSYDAVSNYYAPLCMITSGPDEAPYSINDHAILLTDPLTVPALLDNWQRAGYEIGTYEMRIIKSDADFDNWVRRMHDSGLGVIVDPLVDAAGQFAKGILIQNKYWLVDEARM